MINYEGSLNNYEVRYVFDIGSSSTKSISCIVNTQSNKIVKVLDTIAIPMPYQSFITSSGQNILTQEAMDAGIESIKKILDYYQINPTNYNTKCAGIATAWARNATNSTEYLKYIKSSLGLDITCVSQQEEGELGFRSVIANSEDPKVQPNNIIVLDIGGGSFQLSHNPEFEAIRVYNGMYGSSNFAKEMRGLIKADPTKLLNLSQLLEIIDNFGKKVKEMLGSYEYYTDLCTKNASVYGIGQLINLGIKPIVNEEYITKTQIYDIAVDMSQHTLTEAEQLYSYVKPEFMLAQQTNLILLYSIMDALSIEQIHFTHGAQSTHAIAVYDDIWAIENFDSIWGVELVAAA